MFQILTRGLVVTLSLMVSVAALAQTNPGKEHSRCNGTAADGTDNRIWRWASVPKEQQAQLESGQVIGWTTKTDSDYNMGVIMKLVDADKDLVMGVFSTYSEQKDYVPKIKKSKVLFENKNKAKVSYTFKLPAYIPGNSDYIVNDTTVVEGSTYRMYWDLTSDSPSDLLGRNPEYVDGFMRAEPVGANGARTLIIYCNYAIPGFKSSVSQVNADGFQALKDTVNAISNRVMSMSANAEAADKYRERMKNMFK